MERREAVGRVALPQLDAVVDQQSHDARAAVSHRGVDWSLAARARNVAVGAVLEQRTHSGGGADGDGAQQRRLAARAPGWLIPAPAARRLIDSASSAAAALWNGPSR